MSEGWERGLMGTPAPPAPSVACRRGPRLPAQPRGVLLTLAVPSLIGSNVARLGELLVGPLLAGVGSARHRWLLGPALIAAAVWQVAQPAADLAHGSAPPFAPQTAAMVRELGRLRADTARVEAVPQYGHWESQELADAVPLARGWEGSSTSSATRCSTTEASTRPPIATGCGTTRSVT